MSASKQLTLTGVQQSISPVTGDIKPYMAGKGVLILRNNDATNDAIIGPTGVSAGTGYRLKPGQVLTIPDVQRIDLFAIASAGSPVLDILLT